MMSKISIVVPIFNEEGVLDEFATRVVNLMDSLKERDRVPDAAKLYFSGHLAASTRHADGLLITGCVTRAMELALKKTWEAVPEPRLVIAVGACAISGGPYRDHPETLNGAAARLPVDLFVPGCPPHPMTILDGLLRLLGRLKMASAS